MKFKRKLQRKNKKSYHKSRNCDRQGRRKYTGWEETMGLPTHY